MTQAKYDPLRRVADVMAEDILETSDSEVLAEVAEDHGEPRALSLKFDSLIDPIVQRVEAGSAGMAQSSRQAAQFVRQEAAGGRSQESLSSRLNRWVNLLLESASWGGGPNLFSGRLQMAAASLLVAALIGGGAFLLVRELSLQTTGEQTASSKAPSTELQPQRDARSSAEFAVELAGGRTQEEARANYRNLQAKFPGLLMAREPIIRPGERDGADGNRPYVAVVGPFAAETEANEFCDKLKASGAQCMTSLYSR